MLIRAALVAFVLAFSTPSPMAADADMRDLFSISSFRLADLGGKANYC
jgi:hypothetical protein